MRYKYLTQPLELATFRRTNIAGFLLKTKSWKQYIRDGQFYVLTGRLLLRWPLLVKAAELGASQAYEVPVTRAKLREL